MRSPSSNPHDQPSARAGPDVGLGIYGDESGSGAALAGTDTRTRRTLPPIGA